jgi:hypothetical protein
VTKFETPCFTCGELGHFAKDCPKRANRKEKMANIVTTSSTDDGHGNHSTVLSAFQSPSRWLDTDANIHVCDDISFFSSYQGLQDSSVLMGMGHMILFVVLVGRSEVYFGQDRAVEERAACPYYSQESC